MSYSISIPIVPVEEFDAAIDAAVEAYNLPNVNEAAVEPVAEAVRHMKALVTAGVVAKPGQRVGAYLSGHACVDRESPNASGTTDTMSFNISRHLPAPPA